VHDSVRSLVLLLAGAKTNHESNIADDEKSENMPASEEYQRREYTKENVLVPEEHEDVGEPARGGETPPQRYWRSTYLLPGFAAAAPMRNCLLIQVEADLLACEENGGHGLRSVAVRFVE
jgi:hypothetical protein